MKRVVVTGMGIISPFGRGLDINWECISSGKSAVGNIPYFDTTDYSTKIAATLPVKGTPYAYDPDTVISPKEQRRFDDFVIYGLGAAKDAVEDSGWNPETDEQKERTGVIVGSGIGGMITITNTVNTLKTVGPHRVSPFFIPSSIVNIVAGQISIMHGYRGINISPVSACATGTHAIGEAARVIQMGEADVMLAGGSEAAVCEVAIAGFGNARTLSTHNDEPTKASRPFDKSRDGFVMGEGAAVLVLEEYEHAKKRGAKIYAELAGYGATSDAHHITAPGNMGGYRAMRDAIRKSGLNVADIGYVNAHGTSTPVGDVVEASAVRDLFGADLNKVSVSSTKSMVGHLLGAAGAAEAIYTIQALQQGILPPTINLEDVMDEGVGIDFVPNKAKEKKITAALSNSFGFGGTNASVLFKKV